MKRSSLKLLHAITLAICTGCVPLQQQLVDQEDLQIEGFIGPLIKDKSEFNRVVLTERRLVPEGEFNGKTIPMSDCRCLSQPRIVQDKLIVTHQYGGGDFNRLSTKLFWNGEYHKNSKGEYSVDLIIHSDVVDIRRALFREKKILDIESIQRNDVNTVWINLAGYEQLIRYDY
jgi:hypothetical protein